MHWWSSRVHWCGVQELGPNRNFRNGKCSLSRDHANWQHFTSLRSVKSWTETLFHLFCPKGRSISWALRPKICVGFFLSYFFFSKEKVSILCVKPGLRPGFTLVAYSFWFNGQAVRPGLFALQAVRPEVHTGPARKGWTSLNISGRKAWDVYCVKSRWDTWISH